MLNISKIREDFPIYKHQPELVYLDSTATSLKPQIVIDKLVEYYTQYSSNIFRGLYPLSLKATEEYEKTRDVVTKFIGAKNRAEVIFTRNTSESLNLIAYTLGNQILQENDEIITTIAEHHSNFVPWQQLCFTKKAHLKTISLNPEGTIDLQKLRESLNSHTKIVALTYISNVLGTINPITEIVQIVRKANPHTIIVIDVAQAAPHLELNVQKLKADFVAFSSHKMLGPTGVGILWGKKELLESMPPFLFGGEMIKKVTVEKTDFAELPYKFEAGTPSIAEVIAFKEAIFYLQKIGLKNIEAHEKVLIKYAMERLQAEFPDQIKFIGPSDPKLKTGILAFTFKDFHPHDIADILGQQGICVRAGNHCAMPLHQSLNLNASTRASFYLYNQEEDVEKLIKGLKQVDKILKMGFHAQSQKSKYKEPCC